MRRMKKTFSVLLVLCLLLALTVTARADGGIVLTLSCASNPGIVGLQLTVTYDNSKLRLLSVTDGGILGDEIHHQEEKKSPYLLSWENYIAEENFKENGTLCTLTFRILSGETGEEIPVTLDAGEYGVMNYNLVDMARTLEDSAVTVTGQAPPLWWETPYLPAGIIGAAFVACVVGIVIRKKAPAKQREEKHDAAPGAGEGTK